LQTPDKIQILKSQAEAYPEELLMALSTTYMPDESYHNKVSRIMMKLYENDIFTEGFLISWASDQAVLNESSVLYNAEFLRVFKQHASEFLNWLENAESEEEEEGEERKEEKPAGIQ